jgi:hypothetical protein
MHMKTEYKGKVSFLEQQSIDQSKLLNAQSEQLKNLTKGIQDTKNIKSVENNSEIKKVIKQKIGSLSEDANDSESSQNKKKTFKNKIFKDNKQSTSNLKFNDSYCKLLRYKKTEEPSKTKSCNESSTEYQLLKQKPKKSEKDLLCKKTTVAGKKYSALNESEKSESSTGTESGTEFEEETEEETSYEASHTDSTNAEAYVENSNKNIQVSFVIFLFNFGNSFFAIKTLNLYEL